MPRCGRSLKNPDAASDIPRLDTAVLRARSLAPRLRRPWLKPWVYLRTREFG
jgi:hypothetical protein